MRLLCTAIALSLTLAQPTLPDAAQAFTASRIALPPMSLTDAHWQQRDLTGELTQGRLLVITFSYTTCGAICPIGNDVMAQVDDALPALRTDRPVRLLTVTIDPVQDTPDRMAEAARDFGASEAWVWLTGAPNDIDRLLNAFDASVTDIELHDPVFLVGDPATGRYLRALSFPTPDELIAALMDFTR